MLERSGTEVGEERSSRRQPMDEAEATALLAAVDEVVIARGKSVRSLQASSASVDDLRGPSGGIRAPLLRRGRRLLVGFSGDELERFLA